MVSFELSVVPANVLCVRIIFVII